MMRRAVLLLLGVLLPLAAPAQRAAFTRHAEIEEAGARRYLVGQALLASGIEADLRHLCDRIGARPPGSSRGRRAEDWGYVKLREAGLAVQFDDFKMPVWKPGRVEASVVGPEEERTLHPLPLAHAASTAGEGLTAYLVAAGHCTPGEVEEAGEKLRGKAVLCRTGVPEAHRLVHRLEKMALLADAGAAAMVMVANPPGDLPVTGSVGMGEAAPLPAVSLSLEEGSWIERRLAEDGQAWRLRLLLEGSAAPARVRNVVGEIAGTSRGEVVLACAHLDSWDVGTGAIDNGTGVGVLLEAARLLGELAAQGWTPRRAIRFVLFAGEEAGLHGSRAYLEKHRRDLDGIKAMVNLDIVGDPEALVVHGHDEVLPFLEETARRLAGLGVRGAVNRVALHSDHQPFLLAGVPTVTLLSRLPADQASHYHTQGDNFDRLEIPPLQRAAAATAVLLYDLAVAEELPHRRYGPDETRAMLEAHGLREILEREGAWAW